MKHSCLWDGAVDFDLFVVEKSVNHEPACKPAPLEKLIRQILNHMPFSNIGSLSMFCVRLRKRPAHQYLKNPDYCTDLEDYQGQLDVAHRYTIVAFWVKDLLCKRTTDEG